MDYYTSVKRKKSAYIPLLLYNYEGELFHLRLGESSLTQLYRHKEYAGDDQAYFNGNCQIEDNRQEESYQ